MQMSKTPPTRSLLIRNDKGKVRDLEDVVKIARAQGQTVFKTHKHVRVLKIHGPFGDGSFLVEVQDPRCTENPGVRMKEGGGK